MFPNAEITVYRETPNGTVIGINEDGTDQLLECPMTGYDQESECLCPVITFIGGFQPNASKEMQEQYGHITQSLYTIYIDDISIDIRYDDKVKIKGDSTFYQVLGDPRYYTAILPHIEIPLMKERRR